MIIPEILEEITTHHLQGKSIGLCHGCFDIVHCGHIQHFEYAKTYVDLLIVSITADSYVNKGPNRPVFSTHERIQLLSNIALIDYTIICNYPTAVPVMKQLPFDIYFKGIDYKYSQDSRLQDEHKALKINQSIVYTPTPKYSSTKALAAFNLI